jgi:hypothetical protein
MEMASIDEADGNSFLLEDEIIAVRCVDGVDS